MGVVKCSVQRLFLRGDHRAGDEETKAADAGTWSAAPVPKETEAAGGLGSGVGEGQTHRPRVCQRKASVANNVQCSA